MGRVRRRLVLGLLGIWILTTGSTCQSTFTGSNFQAQGEGAGVILVVLVAAGISCLAYPEACGGGEPSPMARVQMTYEDGVDQLANGDSSGLELICLAGLQGYAKAQYHYGVYLFRQQPARYDESLAWLKRAAAQDHKAARHLLSQLTGWTQRPTSGPLVRPLSVPPPALRACVRDPAPGYVLEAAGPVRQAGS